MTLGKSFHPHALEMSRKGKKIPWEKNISPWQKEALEEAQSLMPGRAAKSGVWAHTSLRPWSQFFLQETAGAAGVSFLRFQGQRLQEEKDNPGFWQVWK